ncbi:MAG: YfhO family protein, partial [Anaerolineae bacterium]|nr:YfhO family protein [Anaerolineae bacterium]
ARAIAALSYPLCNTLIARFGTIPMLEVAAWLPWLLLATDLIIEGYTLRRWLLLAIVLAMMLLAGHAQWTFYSLILAGCYALWQIASVRGSLRKLVPFFLAGAFAVLICAVQLLPTAEFQRLSQRADRLNEGFALNFSYSPVSLVTLFNPDFFGNPGDGSYVIGGLYFETALYIGFIPILFALIGIYRSVGHKQGRFFALVAVIAILLATGRNLPLYPLLYRYVPTFNLFQAPARWLLLAAFALAILAAYGAAAFEATYKIKRRLRLLIAAGAGTAVIGAVFLVLLMMSRELVQMLRGVTWLGVLVALMGGVLLIQPKADSPRRLLWQIALLFVIIADLTLANRLNNPLVAPDFYSSACPPATPVRLFFSEASDTALRDSLLSYDDYRATISNAAQFRCSNLANLNLLDRQPLLNNFDPLLTAWYAEFITQVNDNPADERLAAALRREIKLDGVAQIVAETPQQITIAVDATKDTRLVLMDTYYPGWAATVDGAATEIQQADIAFRAISVPAGEHTVVMTYDPASFKIGAIISLLSLIGLLALLSLPRFRILLGN